MNNVWPSPAPSDVPGGPSASHDIGPSLLFVDDDVASIKVMSRLLAQYGDQRFATTAGEALRQAQAATPDLIILDADMPGMNGFELCRAFKQDPRLASVPVIVATAFDGTTFELQAFESGAADFVSKPLIPEQLRARVRAHLRVRRPAAPHDNGFAPRRRARRERPLLMVVDDDISAVRTLESVLVPLGDVCSATDGSSALRQLRSAYPDILLLDASMPGLNGFEVCAAVKQDPELRVIPVVFVTRFTDAAFEARALDIGAADFIAKPFHASVVRARVRNILELKRANEDALAAARAHWRMVEDARVAEIVRAVDEGVVSVNDRGRIVLANPAACALLGRPDSQLIGEPFSQVFGLELPATTRQGLSFAVEAQLPPPRGTRLELTGSVSGTSSEMLVTVLMRDLTQRDQLRAEADLRLRAEERSRLLGTMVSYVAHELGIPVAGIVGLSRMLADPNQPKTGSTDPARLLSLLQGCAQQLQRVTMDLADIGRLESGHFSVEATEVDVGQCIADAAAQAGALAAESGVAIRVEPMPTPARAHCDAARLTQVLANLCSNAIKYNRRGGVVELVAQGVDSQVVIDVRDDGIGMTADQVAHLFEPFNRLGRDAGPVRGSGLGMSLSRRLVHAMGGTLDVQSRPAAGTTVRIVLPAGQASGPSQAT